MKLTCPRSTSRDLELKLFLTKIRYGLYFEAMTYLSIWLALNSNQYILSSKKNYHNIIYLGKDFTIAGNFDTWWTNKSTTGFADRSKCFIDQYSKFKLFGRNVSICNSIVFQCFLQCIITMFYFDTAWKYY